MAGTGNNEGNGENNVLDPAVKAAILAAATAAVEAAMQNLPAGPQGPQGLQGLQGPPGPIVEVNGSSGPRWNAGDIGFFDPNYEGKSAATSEPIVHTGKDIIFRDVHVFIDRIKDLSLIKGPELIRTNLSTCLRGTALN